MTLQTDVFGEWTAEVLAVRSGRWQPERDRAFWQEKAAHYDAGQPPLPNTVAWLRERLTGAASLLDVGAGTGRLTLPLAGAVGRVTALDHSPDMLAVLRAKGPPAYLHLRQQELADALQDPTLPPHDAVLSAWSLAYLPDLRGALTGLLRLARRDLFLLEDDGVGSPHVTLRRQLAGQPRPTRASSLRRALHALGAEPEHLQIPEERELTFPDTAALLAQARLPLGAAEALAFLRPHLTPEGEGWRYRWTFDVHALHVPLGTRP
ncbi:class I SAM-dependent methyltransferase [Deinococcus hopiensis]|uniref:Methylase involved in ubiquinone/menaquinone biosynthesis n=1 Tax=Deinococcus hopiensis KR-140 TaxID=695939 RepID=A0A1W1UG02_9DEIO|nr:class I SAM-dependent methyltransferase [Deinococcus hopiensis]SMB79969.1 Methylase involved in ubiquinone/menaquinone biosynthesis [Deinococcus hopiensis KR-140]